MPSQKRSMGKGTLGAKGGRGWALDGGFLEGSCNRGGLRRLGAKGPCPIYPDTACVVQTHWRQPVHLSTE